MARNPYIENYEAEQTINEKEMAKTRRTVNRNANQMMERAHNPSVVRDYFDFEGLYKKPQRALDVTPLNPWDGSDADPDDFVRKVEQAYLDNRGRVPMAWLVQQDPNDISLMTPDVAQEVYEAQDDMLTHAQVEAEIKAQTEQRIRGRARLRSSMRPLNLASTAVEFFSGKNITGGNVDMSTVSAEERTQIEEDVRREMLGTGVTSTALASTRRPWTDALFGVAGLAFGTDKVTQAGTGALGWIMEKALAGTLQISGIGPMVDDAHRVNLFGLGDRWRAEQDAAAAATAAEAALPTSELVERMRGTTYEVAFEQLRNENSQEYQDIIDMADGNVALGFALFSDMMDNDIAVQEQMRKLVEDPEHGYRKDLNEFVDTMEEQNYSFTQDVLDALSVYTLPYQLATATSLFFTDSELRSKTVTEGWHNMWEEVAKHENSPASTLGLENTAVGMILDLGAGIAFDPTTWIFGPRMMGMLGRASNKAGAWALRRAPFVQRSMDDAARLAFSDSANISQLVHTLGWLDDAGEMPAALEVLRGVDQTLPGRPYLRMDNRVLKIEEVNVANALRALDPVDLEKLNDAALNVDNLTTSIRGGGFDGAIEFTYSLQDGTLHLTDGLKRLRAARDMNLRGVPTTIRVTDTLRRTTSVPARQLLPDDTFVRTMAQIDQGSAGFGYHFSDDLTPELAQKIVDGQAPFSRGGITNDRAKGLATQSTGGDPIVLVFDQATMDPLLQQALREGDITNISTVRGSRPKPVGWVRLSEFDQLARESFATVTDNAPRDFGVPTVVTEGPAGVPLQSLLGDNPMPQLPKTMDAVEPNVGSNTYMRPSDLLGREFQLGADAVEARAALEQIVERAINNGATPSGMYRYPMARGWSDRIRHMTRNAEGVKWLRRYRTPQNTVQRFELYGANAPRYIADATMRLWGDDTAKIDLYLDRFYDFYRRQAAGNAAYVDDLAKLEPDMEMLRALEDLQGGGWDNSVRFLDDETIFHGTGAEQAQQIADEGFVSGGLTKDLDEARSFAGDDGAVVAWSNKDLDFPEGAVEQAIDTSRLSPEDAADVFARHAEDASPGRGMEIPPPSRVVPESVLREWDQAKLNRAQLHEEVARRTRNLNNELARLDAARAMSLPGGREMVKILEDMWDDFNRTHIASKPFWKEFVDPETGIVPWETLRRGRPSGPRGVHEGAREFLPEDLQAIGKELGVPAEQLSQQLIDVLHEPMAFNAPLSPLEMVMASEAGGAKWTRISQELVGGQVRDTFLGLQKWWVRDKVMQPSTSMTVSFDELQRFFHIGGWRAVDNWMRARADFMAARAAALRHGRFNVESGAEHLSARAQERIRSVTDMNVRYAQAERTTSEGMGLGWADIAPGEPGYLDAARRWTGDMLQSSSFRAYLRGKKAFKEWFLGPDGLQMRNAVVLRKGTSELLNSWQEAYAGWDTLFRHIALNQAKKDGVFAEMLVAFRDTAAKIDAAGGRPHNLPSMVFDHLGPVRGVQREVSAKNLLSGAGDWFFEETFMNPVNFRRGVIADMARNIERTRLVRLFTDQGRRIVSEAEIQNMESLRGYQGSRPGLRQLRDQRLMEMGLVPESYIDDLAELRAMDEVDNLLYTWDQSSRMGMQSRVVFPFGKPWADMAAFWGREVATRPALRGVFAQSSWANSLVDNLKFNPKPLAMISRLAQTDMSFQELYPGQELPFGMEEANLSPLIFLPTDGENPLGSILPGLGFIPLFAMDQVLQVIHDPVEDPEAYQNLVDEVSQIFPSAAYTRGGPISDFLGGGLRGRTAGLIADVFGWNTGKSFFTSSSLLGDISRETANSRELSALLADPEVLNELVMIKDPEVLELQLQGLILQAAQNAASGSILGSVTRALTPIRAEYDSSVGELQDVWFDAAERWPDDFKLSREYDMETDEGRRQASAKIRDLFFDLPQWKRDLYVAEYPSLAVNLVGSWEWTTKAQDDLGFMTTASYRTGSTNADLARHQLYIDRGYVRPLNMLTRTQRILALMQASKDNSARRMYELTAQDINEHIWTTQVSEETMNKLTWVVNSDFGRDFNYQTPREVWDNWGTAEVDLERYLAAQDGISHLSEEYDRLTEAINIPTKERGWGRAFPGTDELQVSSRFEDVTLGRFTPEVVEIAEGLGIELTPGMTGAQFYRGIQDVLTSRDTPLWGMVESAYDQYLNERSVDAVAAWDELREITRNQNLSVEYRGQANAFFRYVYNLEHRLSEGNEQPRPSLAEQEEVARRYTQLMENGQGLAYDWEGGWEQRFQRRYGPREWTPPDPAPVFLEDGEQNPNAYQPYIQRIVDGDTLTVSEAIGAPRLFGGVDREAQARGHEVRLLGILAPERFAEGGAAAKERLEDALTAALRNGDKIWLVRDPETFGASTDAYGRELAWLWIGDQPYHDPSTLRREQTPSGSEE